MSASPLNSYQVELAKALAHPTDKNLRDSTLTTLKKTFESFHKGTHKNGKEGTVQKKATKAHRQNLLKLWKALYYCMWLSDKSDIQLELSNELASFIHIFGNRKLSNLYYKIFCVTLQREWFGLDQHRINKFYLLFRSMLREVFNFIRQANFNSKVLNGFLIESLFEEIFLKYPNGLKFHAADIYLDELLQATEGNISTDQFVSSLQPFFLCLTSEHPKIDSVFIDRILQSVFEKYVSQYSLESRTESDNNSEEKKSKVFLNVDSKVIQSILFEIAGSSRTKPAMRKKLYAIHKIYQNITNTDFVECDEVYKVMLSLNDEGGVEGSSGDGVLLSEKDTVVEAVPTIVSKTVTTVTPVTPLKELPRSKRPREELTDVPSTASGGDERASKKMRKSLDRATPQSKAKEVVAGTTPSSPAPGDAQSPDFISSNKFTGAKIGYIYSKGSRGQGYYLDTMSVAFSNYSKKLSLSGLSIDKAGNAGQYHVGIGDKKKVHWR